MFLSRVKQNAEVFDFELSKDEMKTLSNIQQADLRQYWNPVEDAEVDLGNFTPNK